jgi:hypothetical protein
MTVYRSGLMLTPPLALRGHCFAMVSPGTCAIGDLFPATPALWRCLRCYWLTTEPSAPDHACPDVARALGAGS